MGGVDMVCALGRARGAMATPWTLGDVFYYEGHEKYEYLCLCVSVFPYGKPRIDIFNYRT